MKRNIFLFLFLAVLFVGNASYAIADVTPPNFTSCLNPQGTIQARYDSGVHGIVGDSATYSGQDTVFSLSGNNVTQCFCANTGQGIQTNWWDVRGMNPSDIAFLKNQGWILVQTGQTWGLVNDPYLAQNMNFTCSTTTTAVVEGASEASSNSSNNGGSTNSSSSSTSNTNQIAPLLQLANTGNIVFIYSVFLAGFCLIGIGTYLHFHNRS